jgi:hypothetical protein
MPGYYNVDGEIYPSVTTVLSKMLPEPYSLKMWKRKNQNWRDILKYKATMGSIVHYRILNRLSNRILELPNFSIDEIPYGVDHILEIADTIWNDFSFEIGQPRVIETIHVDKKEKVVGTPDIIAPFWGVRTIGDIKTSKAIYDTHILQIGGYYNMLVNSGDETKIPERAIIISVHPYEEGNPTLQGHYKIIEKDGLKLAAAEFVDLLRKYHTMYSIKRRGNVTRLLAKPPKGIGVVDESEVIVECG